jgi:sporulation protein YlmC with PRC-barrel domain
MKRRAWCARPLYRHPPTVRHVRVVRATTLLGLDVRNMQREELGEIEDLMIDVQEGHIAYVLLGTGGLLGTGEKIRAVPWKAIRVEPIERGWWSSTSSKRNSTTRLSSRRARGKRPPAAGGLLASTPIMGHDLTGKRGNEAIAR